MRDHIAFAGMIDEDSNGPHIIDDTIKGNQRYKVGDYVRIASEYYGHQFDIGTIVKILKVTFLSTDEGERYGYYAEDISDSSENWYITDRELDHSYKFPQF